MASHTELKVDETLTVKVSPSLVLDVKTSSTFLPMNRSFARRLNRLVWEAIEIHYNLACLSTLGGAHHLCNHPEAALVIALRQEMFARKLGSTSVMLRSKVFQAVNLGLLGKVKESTGMFRHCKQKALQEGWTEMSGFVEASRKWLEMELCQQLSRKKETAVIEANGNSDCCNSEKQDHFPVSKAVQELQ